MTIDQMRDALKKAYPGPKWSGKVDNMLDKQVLATYFRLKNSGKL